MHITTTARVTSDKKIVIDKKHQKFLKPGMKLNIIIDQEDDESDKRKAFEFILNTPECSSPGIRVKEITREWIHSNE
jgi:hypothetical protein